MARWKDGVEGGIYDFAHRWQSECLFQDGSLWTDEQIWTDEHLGDFNERFNVNADTGKGTFGDKLDKQLVDTSPQVRQLVAELLAVHFLFTQAVTRDGKLRVINRVLEPVGRQIDPSSEIAQVLDAGIGGPGVGFNTRRDLQVGYLIDFSIRAKRTSDFNEIAKDTSRLKAFADDTKSVWRREMRQIILHLLQPDSFERISSASHKRLIAEAFDEFVTEGPNVDDDDRLLEIRGKLEDLDIQGDWPKGSLDFYWSPLAGVWRATEDQSEDGSDGVSLVEALEWWKQAILYGPPGTSKTFRIKEVASVLIRRAALKSWKAKTYFSSVERVEELIRERTEWVQLHPGFGYEEFVRGMRIRDGDTVYEPGLLLRRIEALKEEMNDPELADLPWVLVLDEINRTDLSRMLGEAFSLLEPSMRGESAELPGLEAGESQTLTIPNNLIIIGTMNLIDQSVEQIDFAMRRRFHWHPCGFNRELLTQIVDSRLRSYGVDPKHLQGHLSTQLQAYADCAESINAQIAGMDELGEEFEIGHTIFADIARPLGATIKSGSRLRTYYLWDSSGPLSPVSDFWRFQLEPLLNQYLSSLPSSERRKTISEIEGILDRPASS